jgi:hypothetical protein
MSRIVEREVKLLYSHTLNTPNLSKIASLDPSNTDCVVYRETVYKQFLVCFQISAVRITAQNYP